MPVRKYEVTEDDLASIIILREQPAGQRESCLLTKNISFNALKGKIIQPVY
jgi:hypothetical protein